MATPPSDDTVSLFKLLADQQWHPYLDIKDKLAATVPPGRALRKYDEAYKSGRRQRDAEAIDSPLSEDDQILFGARKCAQITISSWKGKGVIQRINEDGQKEIRIKPGFQAWGVTLAGPAPEAQDPPLKPEGYTEVPPGDSEGSEAGPSGREAASEPTVEVPLVQVARQADGEFELVSVASTHVSGGELPRRVPADPGYVAGEPLRALPPLPDDNDYAWPPISPTVTVREPVECPECGLDVVSEDRHRQWHEAMKQAAQAQDMALVNEVRFRSLVEGVLSENLDGFQRGMQQYLDQQFALLSSQLFALRTDHPTPQRWTFREGR